eukprot:6720148-Prymnesium_polylepis.1
MGRGHESSRQPSQRRAKLGWHDSTCSIAGVAARETESCGQGQGAAHACSRHGCDAPFVAV